MKVRTWPFTLLDATNVATPGFYNVRQLDGTVVFSKGVDKLTAKEAFEALCRNWDEENES